MQTCLKFVDEKSLLPIIFRQGYANYSTRMYDNRVLSVRRHWFRNHYEYQYHIEGKNKMPGCIWISKTRANIQLAAYGYYLV